MDPKTLGAVGAGIVTVVTPLVFPHLSLAVGAAFYVVAACLFIYSGKNWITSKFTSRGHMSKSSLSPIAVGEHLHAAAYRVEDLDGAPIDGIYAIALCLQAYNSHSSGTTLRNLRARVVLPADEPLWLPIRGSIDGTTDVRHGDLAIIEIGTVLEVEASAPMEPNRIVQVDRKLAEHRLRPLSTGRQLALSSAIGNRKLSIAQQDESNKFKYLWITISADDVISKSIRLQTNLYAENPYQKIEFVTDAED